MARKTILVTGGAGYIGSHIVLCCLLSGQYRVVSIDNFSNSFPEALKRVSKIAKDALPANASDEDKADCQVDAIKGDITKADDIEAIFKKYETKGKIWGVIHVAALKAVGESAQKPIAYYETNISATISLLKIMEQYGCTNLVYSSSATVYGAPKTVPIKESFPLTPESCYGRTKMMSELIIKDVCDSKPDIWRALGLRYFNPAGSHPSGLIGEDPRGKPGNLLPLLAQIAGGKHADDPLKIFGNDYPTPDGTCVRDYIHVMDLAEGHVLCLSALTRDDIYESQSKTGSGFGASGGKYKAYNLGKGRGMSVLNMIEAMRTASGFDYKYDIIGRRTGDVPDLTADPSLAEKELGFKASRTLEEMARDQWHWIEKNPNGYEGQ